VNQTDRDPRAEYELRLTRWRDRLAVLDHRHLVLSNSRLAAAAAIVLLLWLAFARAALSPTWVAVGAIGFGALAVVHARLLNRAERGRRAEALYVRGLERLEGLWAGRGRTGDCFLEDHPYARDLDLFGRGSLFELLNTARTEAGEETLAAWLRSGAAVDEVLARQAAVDELRGNLEFREDVAVLAAEGEVSRTGHLARWSAMAPAGFSPAVRLVFGGCAIVAAALTALAIEEVVPWTLPVAWVLLEYGIAFAWRRSIHLVMERVGKPVDDLSILAELLARIEREPATSPRLSALGAGLAAGGVTASRTIARLKQLVSLYESSTHNLLFIPLTRALLVPEQLVVAIDRWHRDHGRAVAEWLRVVGELEALLALSTYAFERPADPFPIVVARGPLFDGEAIGHPLLPESVMVPNEVRLSADGTAPQVIIVSGSNMSGKSTLLRSVGVNVVLALAGAPVRATRLHLSPLVIGATIRIDDSLQAGYSKFYSEILRIRTIVDEARGPVPLLFLLDEILHGTNSYDRRIGADAIVRALVASGAIGLVTTHDLALTELPARLPAGINMHFEDRLEDGRMVFDYKMRPGVVEHSNALALMRAIGLDV
jgi:MutS domain V